MPILRPRPPVQPSGGATAPGSGVAVKVANKGTNGSDPRFSIAGLTKIDGNRYQDGAGNIFDDSGRMLSGNWALLADTPGLPPSNQSESYSIYTSQAPGGGGSGGAGGSSVLSNPYYQQVLAAINAANAADSASRRTGLQQALISFGLVPENFNDKYGDVDALTRSLAEKNTTSGLSTRARLLASLKENNRLGLRSLASRGLRRSGARGFKLRRNQLEFDQQHSDALGNLLGYAGNLYSQFAQNEYQRALQLASAAQYASSQIDPGFGSDGDGGYVNPYLLMPPPEGQAWNPRQMFQGGPTQVNPYASVVGRAPRTQPASSGVPTYPVEPRRFPAGGGGGPLRTM